jgi:5-formyltetrahydrofolate cyclo-ligase
VHLFPSLFDPMPPIQDAKAALRREMLQRRRPLFAAVPEAGAFAATLAFRLGLIPDDAVVSAYWPMTEEFDARPLIEALQRSGHRVVLPTTPPQGEPLTFRRFTPETALKPGPFGTHEPPPAADALAPTILFLPLLAFDGQGRRLGYGGGYYDRTLQQLRAHGSIQAYGLGFQGQEVARVPTDALDQPLNGVVTERGFRLFSPS